MLLRPDVRIMPKAAVLRGVAVDFEDLWKR